MEFCENVMVSGDYYHDQQEQVLGAPSSSLDDLFASQTMEVDISLEWLSVFVEDCFSSSGNCLQVPGNQSPTPPLKNTTSKEEKPQKKSLKFEIPVKARSKRKRITRIRSQLTSWSSEDPPLLHQTHWLADSELIEQPPIHDQVRSVSSEKADKQEGEEKVVEMRKCSHCQSMETPQWRAGPMGPKTLCNACGVRYKSGRLFPEYRPAKSPTFVTDLHSNSHKKVLEMRLALNGSSSPY